MACSRFSSALAMVDLPAPESPVNHNTQGFCSLRPRPRCLVDRQLLPPHIGRAAQAELDHARRDGGVGETVDQDERAGVGVLGVRVEHQRPWRCRGCTTPTSLISSVLPATWSRLSTLSLYLRFEHGRRRGLVSAFQRIGAPGQHRLLVEPDDARGHLIGDRGSVRGKGDNIAAAHIDLLGEGQRHRFALLRRFEVAVGGDDARHMRALARRMDHHLVAAPRPCRLPPSRHSRGNRDAAGSPTAPESGTAARPSLRPASTVSRCPSSVGP